MNFLIKDGLSKRQAKAKFVSQQNRSINRNIGDTMEQSDNERSSKFEVNKTFNHFIDSELVDEYPSVIHDDITNDHSLRFIMNREIPTYDVKLIFQKLESEILSKILALFFTVVLLLGRKRFAMLSTNSLTRVM